MATGAQVTRARKILEQASKLLGKSGELKRKALALMDGASPEQICQLTLATRMSDSVGSQLSFGLQMLGLDSVDEFHGKTQKEQEDQIEDYFNFVRQENLGDNRGPTMPEELLIDTELTTAEECFNLARQTHFRSTFYLERGRALHGGEQRESATTGTGLCEPRDDKQEPNRAPADIINPNENWPQPPRCF